MAKRLEALNVKDFTTFCFVVLMESEERGDVLDDEELFDVALELAEENEELAEAYCLRFRGFIEMSFHPGGAEYVSSESGQIRFHPALFEVAACARTRKNGSFPERPFFKRVGEVAEDKYHDFRFDD